VPLLYDRIGGRRAASAKLGTRPFFVERWHGRQGVFPVGRNSPWPKLKDGSFNATALVESLGETNALYATLPTAPVNCMRWQAQCVLASGRCLNASRSNATGLRITLSLSAEDALNASFPRIRQQNGLL
jgi:hypothetical protein